MTVRLKQWWSDLRSSLWFLPALIVLGMVALGVALVEVDTFVSADLPRRYPRLFGAGAEGSRGMLATIAGSVMTAVSVTFSITLASLALAASQYTPRVLRNFMRSRANQVVLGVLTGIFAYCLVVLRTVRGGNGIEFVPSLSVLCGFVLALVGVGVLIFFIHHTAVSIQASSLIAAIADETVEAAASLFPEELGEDAEQEESGAEERQPDLPDSLAWQCVPALRTGYVQFVDIDELLRFAREHDAVVKMECGVGSFVIAGTPLVSMAVPGALDKAMGKELEGWFTISRYRTVEQDVGFGIRQIVDIALKALSPGVNDTTTAVTCVDYLTAILVRLAQRRIPSPYRYDAGHLRVIAAGPTFEQLLTQALEQIRTNAEGNLAVIRRMLDGIRIVAAQTRSPRRLRALRSHLDLLSELIGRTIPSPHDRAQLERWRDNVARQLGRPDSAFAKPTARVAGQA
jgi:uncharacterized membrane protein